MNITNYITEAHKPMYMVGMNQKWSKIPKEKLTMPVKSVTDCIKLAADGEEEFMSILNSLLEKVEGAEGSGRIKDTISIERKIKLYGITPADLDDVSGKMIIVKDYKDLDTLGAILKDDDKVVKIADFTGDEDAVGYYGMNVNYKLSNGLVCELQVITRKNYVFKSICGHICYEVARELVPHVKEEGVSPVLDKVDDALKAGWKACEKADKENTIVPYINIEMSDEEMEIVKKYCTAKTFGRFEALVNHRAKEINTKITPQDKKLIEHRSMKSLTDYISESYN